AGLRHRSCSKPTELPFRSPVQRTILAAVPPRNPSASCTIVGQSDWPTAYTAVTAHFNPRRSTGRTQVQGGRVPKSWHDLCNLRLEHSDESKRRRLCDVRLPNI